MTEIYLPIDFSKTREVIPPGEEIIYSTMCAGKGEFLEGNKRINYDWLSHFLLTENGVAFTIPLDASHTKKQIKNLNPRKEHYLPWYNIIVVPDRTGDKPGFIIEKIENEIKMMCFMELVPTPDSESEESFNKRKMLFFEKFKPIQEEKKKEMLDKLYELLKEHPEYNWWSEESRRDLLTILPVNQALYVEVAQRIGKEEKAAKKAEKERLKEEKKRQKEAKKKK